MYYFVPLVIFHRPVALLSHPCRLPVAFLSPSCRKKTPCRSAVALMSLSCRSPVAFSCRFPVASLSPLALLPSCRLPVAFLSLIMSLCLVSYRFPVVSLSPPCRRPVALLSPSCRTSPVAFLSPACRFLSLPCRFPAAGQSSSCRHPVVFLSPPCRLPVAPCRISPSPASRGPNLVAAEPKPPCPAESSRYTQVVSEEASCRSWDALLLFHALRSSIRREWGGKPWTWYRYPIGEAWSRTPFKVWGGGGCHVREGMHCRTGLRESGSRGCCWVLL